MSWVPRTHRLTVTVGGALLSPLLVFSSVRLTLALTCCRKRERSGRWRPSGAARGSVQVLARTSAYLLRLARNGTAHGLRRRFLLLLLRYLIPTTIVSGPTRCSTRASRNPTSCSHPQQS